MAAALTPELKKPISGFTYKTDTSGRALLSPGRRMFSVGIHFIKVISYIFHPDVVVLHYAIMDCMTVNAGTLS